jgi:putative SOS response-associated peptidase YedK
MCGRFSQAESSRRLAKVFGAYADENLPQPRYNVAPSLALRVVLEKDGERRLTGATWGYAPPTDPAAPRARSWINARAETALDSPIFGPALRSRRCLVPADAFYEWSRASGVSQPYAIGTVNADEPMALAGIWTPARAAPRRWRS